MDDLLQDLPYFTSDTPKQQLQQWANQFEAQIDRMDKNQGSFYYLVLSEFYAVYLRDVETGYQMLKRIEIRMPVAVQEIKVRRCFYKYLEGAYQFAIEELQEIMQGEVGISSRKIAADFFKRVFGKGGDTSPEKKSKSMIRKKQAYEDAFFRALKYQRKKKWTQAREIHQTIIQKFGKLDEAIVYESSKSILSLMQKQKLKYDRSQMQQFLNITKKFESKIQNKNYYYQKLEFIFKVLDFIDFKNEEQEIVIDYQLAKSCIVENLEKAISKTKDKKLLASLRSTLQLLEEDEAAGAQICFKFLGDKGYDKLLMASQIAEKSNKGGKSSNLKSRYRRDDVQDNDRPSHSPDASKVKTYRQEDNKNKSLLKQTTSKFTSKKQADPTFQGSNMIKINYNSGGTEERYFYIKDDFMNTLKLYYCQKKGKPGKQDQYYSLKGLKGMTVGKRSEALKRAQCEQFPDDHCFTLKVTQDEKYERNFYVKEKEDFDNWIALFEELTTVSRINKSKIKKTKIVLS